MLIPNRVKTKFQMLENAKFESDLIFDRIV